MTVTIVVAMGANRVIGADDVIPWHLPEDLANFKRITFGHPMVMGRKTFDSIGRALPGRTTIVVTRQTSWAADGVLVAGDLDAALTQATQLDDEVFIVGGGQIYAEALHRRLIDKMVITQIRASPAGDTHFPEVDSADWELAEHEDFEAFSIGTYTRRSIHTS